MEERAQSASKNRVLMLGMYPIKNPRHGGQLRVRAIYESYLKYHIPVRYCSLVGWQWYDDLTNDDIEVDASSASEFQNISPDVFLSDFIDTTVSERFDVIFREFRPSIIQLEQPFLYPWLKSYLQKMSWEGSLIYSSQNVEIKLKEDMLTDFPAGSFKSTKKEDILRRVTEAENSLVEDAKLVIACTTSDAKYFEDMGARQVVVGHNAIKPLKVDSLNFKNWKKYYHIDMKIRKLIVFIGSAHPPNEKGFTDLVGYKMGFLPRDTGLIIIGGVSELIEQKLRALPEHVRETFSLRARLLGKVAETDLASFIRLANVIILPINQGGGSNLKTAEALMSERNIVATDMAFRSYEEYKNLPNVYIANDMKSFKNCILQSISSNDVKIVDNSKTRIKLTWNHTLRPVIREVSKL